MPPRSVPLSDRSEKGVYVTTSKYTTIRVLLSSDDDTSSVVSRERLEAAFVELLSGSGAHFNLCGTVYRLSDVTVVGR